MKTVTPTLSYARDGSTVWRKWFWRLVCLAWIVALGYLAYDLFGHPIRLRIAVWNAEVRCGSFSRAPDEIIFETETSRTAALSGCPGYAEDPEKPRKQDMPFAVYAMPPAAWTDWIAARDQQVHASLLRQGRRPSWSDSFARELRRGEVVAFMQHRQAVGGSAKLLVVTVQFDEARDDRHPSAMAFRTVVIPTGLFASWESVRLSEPVNLILLPVRLDDPARWSMGRYITMYSGQRNPDDASQFSIDYEDPKGRHTIIGTLCSDDTVVLKVVDAVRGKE